MHRSPAASGATRCKRTAATLFTVLAGLLEVSPALWAAPLPILATDSQRRGEVLALRVLASAPVRREMERLEEVYRRDAQGSTPTGRATIRRAVDSVATAAVYYAVIDDADRPVLMWIANAPHRWFGMELPRAGFGIENPDNVYREMTVDGAARYEIRGRVQPPRPAEVHFVVMDSIPGTTPMSVEGGAMLATLRSDAMAIAPDGSFTITLDREPANGRSNHLQIPPQGRYPLLVRDLFTDWTQLPVALEVRRISGPPLAPPRTEAQIARRAAEILAKIGPYWVQYDNRFIYSKPVNAVRSPRHRPGGRGFSSSGHFSLAADEALLVTLDPLGAASLGFQLTDPWGVAYEYMDRTSSLNNAQVAHNTDGTITYVIARQDPEVFNWLDPEGYGAGMFVIRWQALPAEATGERAVREARVVKLAELKQAMPAGMRYVSTDERQAQRRERARSYETRLQ